MEGALFTDPIQADAAAKYSLHSDDFADWQRDSQPVEKTPAADAWYLAHQSDIEAKRADYMQKWNRMEPRDKAVLALHAEDGV